MNDLIFPNALDEARALDAADALAPLREQFTLPRGVDGETLIYLCGNSLGLQPKEANALVQAELDRWATLGVEGHFQGETPWFDYHRLLTAPMARVVGALPHEVVVMGSLTANLHLLMVSFYRPTTRRHKILIEPGAFPSDQYAVASQARFHGYDPAAAIVELEPRAGEVTLRTEDIVRRIAELGDELALVMLGGVNYYTGQAFELGKITRAGHAVGAVVGFDLAHAAGNLELKLHTCGADFAAWCSYKYLNSGPGGVAGIFVHERHAHDATLPRFAGWWGNDPETRFEMGPEFIPAPGAEGWQLSNAPVLSMAALRASLALFDAAGMARLRRKSEQLTAFMLQLLDAIPHDRFELITPREPEARGAQLSIRARQDGRALFDALQARGVVCDFRRPDVIRVAPAPLYNSFEDVWRFCHSLVQATA